MSRRGCARNKERESEKERRDDALVEALLDPPLLSHSLEGASRREAPLYHVVRQR